jgi:hypothetical protein
MGPNGSQRKCRPSQDARRRQLNRREQCFTGIFFLPRVRSARLSRSVGRRSPKTRQQRSATPRSALTAPLPPVAILPKWRPSSPRMAKSSRLRDMASKATLRQAAQAGSSEQGLARISPPRRAFVAKIEAGLARRMAAARRPDFPFHRSGWRTPQCAFANRFLPRRQRDAFLCRHCSRRSRLRGHCASGRRRAG